MRLRWLSVALAAVAATVVLAACGGDDAGSKGAAAGGLIGKNWVLDTAALGVSGSAAVTSTIRFETERVSGNDGCNQFSGPYERDGSSLKLGPLAGTQMACPGPAGEVAQQVTSALGRVASYALTGASLSLRDAAGQSVLTYRASAPGVAGPWAVVSVLYDDAIRSVIAGTTLTADFGADGRVSGSTGCNTFHGPYEVQGERLRIGPLASTRKACHDPKGTTAQEHGYLAALESVVRFEQTGSQLTLFNAKGQMAVVLGR